MYRFLVFLHLAGIFGFLLAHGASAAVAFALRRERRVERIRALLDLSAGMITVFYGALLMMIAFGIVSGFAGGWWGSGWIWLSIGILVAMMAGMWFLGTSYYARVRQAVALDGPGPKFAVPGDPVSAEELDALLARGRPWLLAAIGYGGALVVAALMWFKPF